MNGLKKILFLNLCVRLLFCDDIKVSIITSIFKGEKYIETFMHNITNQSIFNECELILIDACSPENEYEIIKKYLERFNNIIYYRTDKLITIYEAWNMAIKISRGKYITNANLDDQRAPDSLYSQSKYLDNNPNITLVYSDLFITFTENDNILKHIEKLEFGKEYWPISNKVSNKALIWYQSPKYLKNMRFNPPGPMPMWRKSVHDKIGYFDERYTSAGDWEFWLKAVCNDIKFSKTNFIAGLYYFNPNGLSTSKNKQEFKKEEELEVYRKYKSIIA